VGPWHAELRGVQHCTVLGTRNEAALHDGAGAGTGFSEDIRRVLFFVAVDTGRGPR
jgi:hypothetical protein